MREQQTADSEISAVLADVGKLMRGETQVSAANIPGEIGIAPTAGASPSEAHPQTPPSPQSSPVPTPTVVAVQQLAASRTAASSPMPPILSTQPGYRPDHGRILIPCALGTAMIALIGCVWLCARLHLPLPIYHPAAVFVAPPATVRHPVLSQSDTAVPLKKPNTVMQALDTAVPIVARPPVRRPTSEQTAELNAAAEQFNTNYHNRANVEHLYRAAQEAGDEDLSRLAKQWRDKLDE